MKDRLLGRRVDAEPLHPSNRSETTPVAFDALNGKISERGADTKEIETLMAR